MDLSPVETEILSIYFLLGGRNLFIFLLLGTCSTPLVDFEVERNQTFITLCVDDHVPPRAELRVRNTGGNRCPNEVNGL